MQQSSIVSEQAADPGTGYGPVRPVAPGAQRPLALGGTAITGGFWGERQRINREISIPIGSTRLREAGNLDDLAQAAAAVAGGRPSPASYRGPLFMDSDVYKWLEAVAWEHARTPSSALRDEIDTFAQAILAAQETDGYVNSYVQVTRDGQQRYRDLAMGHELYCFGHLIQAAVATHRTIGDCTLWQVALRVADHLTRTFGPGRNTGLDGHPAIEMALVELFRETGEQRYLTLAEHFVNARGHSTIAGWNREPIYFSDRLPVRDTIWPEGHAVRAMYLAAGAADVACEREDGQLGDALDRQWQAMVESKQYLTGGLGARWDGEAFGDPYELPPDVAYAETCASIGALQWAWRRLLATGDVNYADGMERLLCNGFVSGVSLSGDAFFYVNALQVRADTVPDDHRRPVNGRQQWFQTACCPPNVMRTISQLAGYLATVDDDGMYLHQYAPSVLEAPRRRLRVETNYPWDGRISVTVDDTDDTTWTLSLRVPAWCPQATLRDPDGQETEVGAGQASMSRVWARGDVVVLDLPMPVRLTGAHPRVDAVRGCRAIERGPLVYAVEQCDLDAVAVDDVRIPSADPSGFAARRRRDLLGDCVVVTGPALTPDGRTTALTAVPYCLWANREVGPMRVWLPLAEAST